jgi:FMN phosphatase YigB (HAD superfamily)
LIRGIVFDLFDTLVDTNHDRLPSIEFEGRRISATTPRLHHHATNVCGLSLSLAEFADLQRAVDRSLFRETLKRGIELPTLRRFEVLAGRLGLGAGSDLPADRKPRPEIFDEVARALDLAPDEILHVGDSLEADVAGAGACGMHTVWLTRQVSDPDAKLEAYDGPLPDFALEDLLDLPVLAARLSV